MAVFLSPIGGAGWQFFNNSGSAPLSGGKLYTYAAGTTTPLVTYTSSVGITAHTNPIVLNSGGRVPGGEIWLTDNVDYKFVLRTSTDVLIDTYDNISGINDVNASDILYTPSGTSLFGASPITVKAALDGLSDEATGSSKVGYDAATGYSTPRTVENRLQERISVKDFGAVGDGVADDTTAIQACINYCNTNGLTVYLPAGSYKITDSLVLYTGAKLHGESFRSVEITGTLYNKSMIRTEYGETPTYTERTFNWDLRDFRLVGTNAAGSTGLNFGNVGYANLKDVFVQSFVTGLFCSQRTYYTFFNNLTIQDCEIGADLTSDGGANFFVNANIGFTDFGVKVTSGGWSFTSCVVDTGTTGASAFFSVGQNGFLKSANVYLIDVYVEGVDAATSSVIFYDNTVTSGVIGMQRRNLTGPITYANQTTAESVIVTSWGITTPAQRFWRIVFDQDYQTDIARTGLIGFEGSTLQVLASDLANPGGLSVDNLYVGGGGFTTTGVYHNDASPEGAITAAPGSLCLVNTGLGSGSLYVKATGNGNTGWVLK